MKWFDSNEENIKNKESLEKEQINYLTKSSFSIFGPFNMIVRKQWDVFLAFLGLRILGEVLISESSSFIVVIGLFTFYVWLIYFSIKYGRRLAWNRNNWESFEKFKSSEKAWAPWGIIVFVLLIALFIF